MRTYGKDQSGKWQLVTETSYIWLTTLIQNLRLIQGESPFYSTAGIPAYQSIQTQIAPDIAVNNIQSQFAQYFSSLVISKVSGTSQPTYNVSAVFLNGTVYQQVVS